MRTHDRIGAQRCKGRLRLEFVFDLLYQGKARVESPVHQLLILPFIGVKPDERVEQALLRFAQTADREFAVENGEGRLIGNPGAVRPRACGGRRPLSLRRGSWPFAKTLRMQQGRAETLEVSARNQQSNFGGGTRVRSSREDLKNTFRSRPSYIPIRSTGSPTLSRKKSGSTSGSKVKRPQAFLGACSARMDGRLPGEVRKIPDRHSVFS